MSIRAHPRQGFVLVTASALLVVLLGMLGLAVDLGRVYIFKNELQTFTDAAALAGSLELNGTSGGLDRARSRVDDTAAANKWNFASALLSAGERTVEFAASANGAWSSNPSSSEAAAQNYMRVTAAVSVPVYFLGAVQAASTQGVSARSVAGRVTAGQASGLLPFSPIAPSSGDPANFGFVTGQRYALRWASDIGNSGAPPNGSVCPGDLALGWDPGSTIDRARQSGSSLGSSRGYWGSESGPQLDDWIDNGYPNPVATGSAIAMAGGVKNGRKQHMESRVNSDSDHTSTAYSTYEDNLSNLFRVGNGRRVIGVPLNAGPTGNGNGNGNGNGGADVRTVIGIAAFFLDSLTYDDTNGNEPFCGEYAGTWVQGANGHSGGSAGIAKVRLVP